MMEKEQNYCIDVFAGNSIFVNCYKQFDYEKPLFLNFLRYICIIHQINVTDLAKALNVSRQTLYNYFPLHTSQMPQVVKDKITYIYGAANFDQVIDLECANKFENDLSEELEEKLANGLTWRNIRVRYKYMFQELKHKEYKGQVVLRSHYRSSEIWTNVIYLSKTRKNSVFDEELSYLQRAVVIHNTPQFSKVLFKSLISISPDDFKLLEIIKDYIKQYEKNQDNN